MALPPTTPEEQGILIKAGAWVVNGLTALIVLIATTLGKRILQKHDEEIAAIKAGIKTANEGIGHLERRMGNDFVKQDIYETHRKERREDIRDLHVKIEKAAGDLHEKIDTQALQLRDKMDTILTEITRRRDTRRGND